MSASRLDLKNPGRLLLPVVPRARALGGPVQVILVGVALTDILLKLLDRSRTAAVGRSTPGKSEIEDRLREFERAWEQATGEHLTTAAFYDRFCAGDFDTRFGSRWATYYEATLARQRTVRPSAPAT